MSLNGVANNLLANKMFHSNKANTVWVIFPKLKKKKQTTHSDTQDVAELIPVREWIQDVV